MLPENRTLQILGTILEGTDCWLVSAEHDVAKFLSLVLKSPVIHFLDMYYLILG